MNTLTVTFRHTTHGEPSIKVKYYNTFTSVLMCGETLDSEGVAGEIHHLCRPVHPIQHIYVTNEGYDFVKDTEQIRDTLKALYQETAGNPRD